MKPNLPRRRQLGTSLVEATVVLAVAGTLASSVLPGWHQVRERRALEAASAQLATDLRLARSHAVAHGEPVRLRVSGTNACYVIHTGPAGSCSCSDDGQARCIDGAAALQVAVLPGQGAVKLSASSSSMLFDADRGTVTPTGTLRLRLDDGQAVHHVVNIMGRVRSCSPDGRVAGHPPC